LLAAAYGGAFPITRVFFGLSRSGMRKLVVRASIVGRKAKAAKAERRAGRRQAGAPQQRPAAPRQAFFGRHAEIATDAVKNKKEEAAGARKLDDQTCIRSDSQPHKEAALTYLAS